GAAPTPTTGPGAAATQAPAVVEPTTAAVEPTAAETTGENVTPTAGPTVEAAAQPTSAAGAANLQLMGWSSSDAENENLQKIIDQFNQSHPNIHVTLNLVPQYDTTLQTALAGGTPPDVFYVDSFKLPDLVKAGALASGEGKINDPEDFYDSVKNAFTYNGTFWCPPKDFSTLGLIYNKDMLDAAGVKVPTNWDELRAAAEKLTNKDKQQYGMVLPADFARWIAFLYQAGGRVTNEDFTKMEINSPEAKQAMEFYTGMVADQVAAQPSDVGAGWPGEAFGKGNAAMVVEGNWIVPFLKRDYPDVNYGVAELPAGPADKATMAFTVCYAVPKNAANPDASWELVNFLTGQEGMKAWTDLGLAMPTRKSLRDEWVNQFSEQEAFLKGADYAHPWQFVPGFGDVLDTINAGLQGVMTGVMTVDQALQQAEEVGNQVLSKNK
ncbi:MAG TPA: hypothetical protein DEP84_33910, partial [Chloroflexi bacterium]|nr:hypothetical protein [Chloroflexota bacterium]